MIVFPILLLFNFCIGTTSINNCDFSIVGGGIGGLYSAWRLINSSTVKANKLCIFEKESRVGGRIYSLRNEFPYMKTSVDIGAHRFDKKKHRLVNFIVNDLLNLNTICYSRTDNCKDNGKSYLNLRNTWGGSMGVSSNFPYNFNTDEQWGPTLPRQDPIDLGEELYNLYPFLIDAMDNLTSKDDSIAFPTFKTVMTRLRNTKVNGRYPHELDIRTALNHSSEFWQFFLDVEGETNYLIETNVYDTIKYNLVDAEKLRVIADNDGNEIGYSTMPEGLATLLISQGVKIYYQHQLISLYVSNNNPVLVVKNLLNANVYEVDSKKVILNIPITALNSLSHDSVIFTAATPNALKTYQLFMPVAAGKVYGYYDRAWWKLDLNITSGDMCTTNDLRYYELSDNVVECNGTNCRGIIQFMYTSEQYINFFKNPQVNRYDPKVVLGSGHPFLLELHQLFVTSLDKWIRKAGIDPNTIAPPTKIVEGIWEPGWHFIPASDMYGGLPTSSIIKPVTNMDIYIVNEGYGMASGWAESSLVMAEKVMKLLGLTRPSFLVNDYWYDAFVTSDL